MPEIVVPYLPLGYEPGAPCETAQIDFWESTAFSPAFLAARGAGKTLSGAAKTLKNILEFGSNALVVGPRYESQVRAVLVEKYLELIPKELIWCPPGARPYHETHKVIYLVDPKTILHKEPSPGPQIWFRSGDEPDTIEGFTVGTVHLDEAGRMVEEVFGLALGCLRDPRGPGQIIVTCTPPFGRLHWVNRKWGNGRWEELKDRKGRQIINSNPEYPAWNMIWTDNYKLTEYWRKNIEEGLNLDSAIGRQQLLGEPVDVTGIVYADFDPRLHVQTRPDEFIRIVGGIDRALSGVTAVVLAGQDKPGRTHWFHEWGKRNCDLEELGLHLLGLQQQYPQLWFEADPRPGGEMELESLRQLGVRVYRADKRDMLDVGVKLIWRLLRVDATGMPGLFVREWLSRTISQMQSWSFTEGADMGAAISYHEVEKHNRDFIDAARYATMALNRSDRIDQPIRVVWGPKRERQRIFA